MAYFWELKEGKDDWYSYSVGCIMDESIQLGRGSVSYELKFSFVLFVKFKF